MQILKKLRALPRENWLLFFAILINRMGNMALVFLILYLHDSVGMSVTTAGIIFSLYGIGALVSGPIGGLLVDRYGALWVMFVSLIFLGIILLAYPLTDKLFIIIPLTFLWGFTNEMFRPANQVAIIHFCSIEQRKIAFALNRLGINLGMSIAPIIGGILASHYFKAIFVFNGISVLLAATFLFYEFRGHFKFPDTKIERVSAFYSLKAVFSDPRMFYVMFAFLLSMLVFFQVETVLPIFLVKNIGILLSSVGLLFSINMIMIIFFEIPLNVFTSDWPHNISMGLGAVFIAIGFGMYAFVHTVFGVVVGIILWTIAEMILMPAMAAYVMEIAAADQRGAYMGIYSMGVSVALIVAPILGTQILGSLGASALWFMCFVIGIISAIMFFGNRNLRSD